MATNKKEAKKQTFSNCIRVLMLISCIAGFYYVVSTQWQNYVEKATSTKTQYIKHENLSFPYFVFCPKKKLRDDSPVAIYNGFGTYDELHSM